MEKFWLSIAVLVFVLVSYLCLTVSFERWGIYYIFVVLALFTWLMRRFMRKRMEKHNEYLDSIGKSKK